MRIKSREKTIVRASDKVQVKIVMVGDVFGENGDEKLVLSSFTHCKLKYLGPWCFTVDIIFIMFKSM